VVWVMGVMVDGTVPCVVDVIIPLVVTSTSELCQSIKMPTPMLQTSLAKESPSIGAPATNVVVTNIGELISLPNQPL